MPSEIGLVTSWGVPCGIAEHSALLIEAVELADPDLKFVLMENKENPLQPEQAIDHFAPDWIRGKGPRILHLNYHLALHSRWVPEWVPKFQKQFGLKVVVTFHDTGVPNNPLSRAMHDVCDAMIVHEPASDLPRAHYLRMGVPRPNGRLQLNPDFKAYPDQPVLGTIGFPFGWKHYDQLAQITGEQGWAFLLLAPGATDDQITQWRELNPCLQVYTDFTDRELAVSILAGCDATAFTYVCHNTGQSAAILQGIAARKPVIALHTCRQFRALYMDPIGRATIRWAESFDDVAAHLRHVKIQRIDPGMVALAEQESWAKRGRDYAAIYRSLL